MVLTCPRCREIHIDAPDPATGWTNPPHTSHLCHNENCRDEQGRRTVWRPADVPTVGVASLTTHGKADNWSPPVQPHKGRHPRWPDQEVWMWGTVVLPYPWAVAQEPRAIRQDVTAFDAAAERFGIPRCRIYASNVTALIYLSWLPLRKIEADGQDPHIGQYAGTWSEITREELEKELQQHWRPDPDRRPISSGMPPGWEAWRTGKPLTWRELH